MNKTNDAVEKFSYSKLETYNDCSYKYKLRYVDKKYISSDNVASSFGSLLHKIFEIQTNNIINGEKIDYDFLKKYFVDVNVPKKNKYDRDGDMFGVSVLREKYKNEWFKEDKIGKTYEQKADEFLETGIYRQEKYLSENPELELYAAELPFEYNYRGYCFRGFIDRVLVHRGSDNKHFEIHDLKTSSVAYDDKKCVTPLQFVIYCKALRQMFGEDILIDCFYEFPVAGEMKRAGTRGFEDRGMKKIDKLLDGIESCDFAPNASPLCHWCEYSNGNPNRPEEGKNMCPYYSLWTPTAKSYATKLPWLGMNMDEIQRKRLIALDNLNEEEEIEI